MRLVDTSAWIEWLRDSPTGEAIRALLPSRDAWLVPTMVQLELVKWLSREVGEEPADQVIALTRKCRVVDLDTRLAITAADVSARHKLATADAVVYATAVAHDADVLTCDSHFEGLPKVIFIPKRGA